MGISKIVAGLANLAGTTPRAGTPPSNSFTPAVDTPPEDNSASSTAARLQASLAGYDLEQITPRQFGELLQKLRASNTLGESDLQALQQLRVELDQQLPADTPFSLTQHVASRAQIAEGSAAAAAAHQQAIIARLAAAGASKTGVDTVA